MPGSVPPPVAAATLPLAGSDVATLGPSLTLIAGGTAVAIVSWALKTVVLNMSGPAPSADAGTAPEPAPAGSSSATPKAEIDLDMIQRYEQRSFYTLTTIVFV